MMSYRPPVYFFDLNRRDPKVSMDTLVDVVKTILYPYVRRFLRK
jgi:hypothetical protein